MFTELIASGIHPGLDKYEAKRTRIVNLISLLCAILVVVYGIIFWALSGEYRILYPAILFGPLFMSILWMTGSRHYKMAKVCLQVLFSGIILYYGVMFGGLAEVQLFAVFSICIVLLSFRVEDSKMMLFSSLLPISCVVLLEVNYEKEYVPALAITPEVQHIFRWLIMSVVFSLCILAVTFHSRANDSLQKEVDRQNARLERYSAELEMLVRERTAALEKVNEEKSRYLSETSHETRNYINAIIGLSDILLQESRHIDMPAGSRQIIEDIFCNSHDMRGMLTNVLELSKIEAGMGEELREEPVTLETWLMPVTNTYTNIAKAAGISLIVEMSSLLPACIMTDPSKITRMLNNLLSNAIKVTPKGKSVTLGVHAAGDALSFTVQDCGPGITPEKLRLLFRPFTQLGFSSDHKGTGLGLAITRRYAEQMGGAVTVESTPGAGSTFRIRVPMKVCEEVVKGVEETYPSLQDKKILVIEDDQINSMILERFLLPLGAEVATCANGSEGISTAKILSPDLIILDISMPVMDGKETTRVLRSLPQFAEVPIIVLSSNAFREEKEAMMALGADEYIVKPVLRRQLTEAVFRHIYTLRGMKSEAIAC